jgi:hypothetical protein
LQIHQRFPYRVSLDIARLPDKDNAPRLVGSSSIRVAAETASIMRFALLPAVSLSLPW